MIAWTDIIKLELGICSFFFVSDSFFLSKSCRKKGERSLILHGLPEGDGELGVAVGLGDELGDGLGRDGHGGQDERGRGKAGALRGCRLGLDRRSGVNGATVAAGASETGRMGSATMVAEGR